MKVLMFICFALLLILASCVLVYAQDTESEAMEVIARIFSPALAVMVTSIIGVTKVVRNMVNLKGPLAVVITVVVSIVYSIIQYYSEGLGVAILVGLLAAFVSAGGFWLTKLFGKEVNPGGTK